MREGEGMVVNGKSRELQLTIILIIDEPVDYFFDESYKKNIHTNTSESPQNGFSLNIIIIYKK